MESLIVIILGLLLFVIPELFRSKKQKYEYPEIPDPEQEMHRPPIYYESEGVNASHGPNETTEGVSLEWEKQMFKHKVEMPAAVDIPPQLEEENPWTGQLRLPSVVNGVIFAEIMQPPRAKRPVACWLKK